MAMSPKILQVNLKFSGFSKVEFEQAWLPAAQPIADTPGLRWKIWLMDEEKQLTGGIYLFDDEASAQAFLEGPIMAALRSNPSFQDISTKIYSVMEEHTIITRGPVREGSPV